MKRPQPDIETDPRLEEAGAWCVKLANGALEPDDQAQFHEWLDRDPENRRALEDAVGAWRAVGDTSLSPELLALRRDALEGFEAANRARWGASPRRKPLPWRAALIAAAIVLTLGGGALFAFLQRPADYRTGVGERRVIVLTDGSKVSLDAATEVRVRYDHLARRLWLDHGRAKFDVARDASRPFTVTAADKVVRATGTAFSVELVQGQVQVVLYEGRVAVLEDQGTAGKATRPVPLQARAGAASTPVEAADAVFTPGHELIVPVRLASAEVVAIDPVRSLAWEGGQLVFNREPLATAVDRINRYTDQKISIGDARAGQVKIDGVFKAGDTEAFIEGITEVFPVRVRDTKNGKVFVSAR